MRRVKEMLRDLTKDIWNVPNMLTMARLIMIPVFVVLDLTGHFTAALIVFCLASLTDCLDGFLARKNNQVTSFGKLFDPLADKVMVVSALICHGIWGFLPWVAIIIAACKEIYMVAGSTWMLNHGHVVSANIFGKAATVAFICSLVLSFFHEKLMARWGIQLDVIILWISVGLALEAAFVYTVESWKTVKAANAAAEQASPPEETGPKEEK